MASRRGAGPITRSTRSSKHDSDHERPTSSREEAMEKYIKLASRKNRKKPITTPSRSTTTSAVNPQLLISVGRMYHDEKLGHGKTDRSFDLMKINFDREERYEKIIEKCKRIVWSDFGANASRQFYLADGSGTCIEQPQSQFEVSRADGQQEVLPWTLENYLKVSNLKFASRARLYCVMKTLDDTGVSDPPPGYFSVKFVSKTLSRYSGLYSFRTGISQVDLLCNFLDTEMDDEMDVMMSTRDTVGSSSSGYQVLEHNPLSYGFSLYSISEGDTVETFVEDMSAESGVISYGSPTEGSSLDVCVKCFASQEDGRVMLAVMAMNGYHSTASYQWLHNKTLLKHNKTPLLYTSRTGTITCVVTAREDQKEVHFCVTVEGQAALPGGMSDRVTPGVDGQALPGGMSDSQVTLGVEGQALPGGVSDSQVTLGVEGQALPGGVSDSQVTLGSTFSSSRVSDSQVTLGSTFSSSGVSDSQVTLGMEGQGVLGESNTKRKKQDPQHLMSTLRSVDDMKKLTLHCEIGQGSFAKVYKAFWRGTAVAAKVIPISVSTKAIEKELLAYRNLIHPNLLNMLGVVTTTTSVAIVTNLVDGKDLHDLIFCCDSRKLTESEKIAVCIQVCQGLLFMHTATPPVIHMDLKPANILVQLPSLHCFIADFGLATCMRNTNQFGTATMRAGTPGFQAPEQLMGVTITDKCDVYAFGGVMTELFGEKPLWDRETPYSITYKVTCKGQFPEVSHLPDSVQCVVKLCFQVYETRADTFSLLKALLNLNC
ncbi:uncharacterized protein LOC135337876 isoform X3 [Halichondria panicea]|uniref:uncharacterized protein LOC135337876 isoform X3 n=1 Tax=Halichondria panicea TaxID=6063 RepID=UPI00312BC715